MISHSELLQELHYDLSTGYFTWLKRKQGRKFGKPITGKGRRTMICIDYESYPGSHLAWFYMTGRWPTDQIDHRDGDETNNAWSNLRECTQAQNLQNLSKRNQTIGVTYSSEKNRFYAGITKNGQRYSLGGYGTAAEAQQAYLDAKKIVHTFNPIQR